MVLYVTLGNVTLHCVKDYLMKGRVLQETLFFAQSSFPSCEVVRNIYFVKKILSTRYLKQEKAYLRNVAMNATESIPGSFVVNFVCFSLFSL